MSRSLKRVRLPNGVLTRRGLSNNQTRAWLGNNPARRLKNMAAHAEQKIQRQIEAQRLIDQIDARKTTRRRRVTG